jgi:hypothetical protein
VQPLEDAEQFVGVLHVESDAVVFDDIPNVSIVADGADLNHGNLT